MPPKVPLQSLKRTHDESELESQPLPLTRSEYDQDHRIKKQFLHNQLTDKEKQEHADLIRAQRSLYNANKGIKRAKTQITKEYYEQESAKFKEEVSVLREKLNPKILVRGKSRILPSINVIQASLRSPITNPETGVAEDLTHIPDDHQLRTKLMAKQRKMEYEKEMIKKTEGLQRDHYEQSIEKLQAEINDISKQMFKENEILELEDSLKKIEKSYPTVPVPESLPLASEINKFPENKIVKNDEFGKHTDISPFLASQSARIRAHEKELISKYGVDVVKAWLGRDQKAKLHGEAMAERRRFMQIVHSAAKTRAKILDDIKTGQRFVFPPATKTEGPVGFIGRYRGLDMHSTFQKAPKLLSQVPISAPSSDNQYPTQDKTETSDILPDDISADVDGLLKDYYK